MRPRLHVIKEKKNPEYHLYISSDDMTEKIGEKENRIDHSSSSKKPNAEPSVTRVSVVDAIHEKIWKLSPLVHVPESYTELVALTNQLIHVYELQGRLAHDPFESTWQRTISCDVNELTMLKGSVCVVTGGLGCVGSKLVLELGLLEVKTIIILDLRSVQLTPVRSERIISIECDIRDAQKVKDIFLNYSPEFVFHVAAQRDPGLAETNTVESVTTNVVGTYNVIHACEGTPSVKQMVFSSTGKASRYYTEEIYAASKKVGEYLINTYAENSRVKYSMARFTHILDNSLMNRTLHSESEENEYVSVHSPGKYVTAQNVGEASSLMLNALIHSEEKKCNFLLVRHLDWPVESLEVALYYIKQSKRQVPVIYTGNPLGYSEKLFRGQLDWSNLQQLNLLLNVYELRSMNKNEMEDIIICKGRGISKLIIEKVVAQIALQVSEKDMKKALVDGLKEMVRESLKMVDKRTTTEILKWGLESENTESQKVNGTDFNQLIVLLENSLLESEYNEVDNLAYQLV